MGLLDPVRDFLRRTPSPMAPSLAVVPSVVLPVAPERAEGISGGSNQGGRLQYEPNAELRDQAGYGRVGTYDIGQWKEMELSNPYVAAGLDFILSPVADARVDVEAPLEMDEAQAKQLTDFVKWALTDSFRLPIFNEVAARGFLLSGFSLFEPVFKLATFQGRERFTVKSLEQRLPSSLDPSPWIEDDSGLIAIRQSGPRGMSGVWERKELPADRVLLFSWKREANNWAGVSQLRAVWYIAAKVMPMLLKLTGVSLQREGAGIPIATATDKATPLTGKQREDLAELLSNATFHESMSVIMPAGWDLKWVYSPGANKGHVIQAWKDLGLAVLQQLSAQQMVLGTDNTGSRSVGEVHDARASAFVRKVLRFLEGVINGDSGEVHSGLVKRLVDFNFGPQVAYPRVKLTMQRPEIAPTELASASVQAKTAGLLTVTAKDENAMRERLGFAPITEEERTAAKEAAAALAPQLQPGFGGPGDQQKPGEKKPDDEKKPAPEDAPKGKWLQASAPRLAWKPWRPLRASEEALDLPALDAFFAKQRDVFEALVKPEVVGMLAKAAPSIAAAMADGVVKPAEIAAVPLDTKRLKAVLTEYLADVRDAGQESVRKELGRKRVRAAAEEDEMGDEREDDRSAIVDDADEVIEAQRDALIRKMENRLRSELERESIDALRTGADADDVVSRTVSRQLDTGAFRSDAGYVTTKAFSVGRDEAARIMGGIAEAEYTAILDNGTCEACASMDGETAPFGSEEHDAMVPPNRDCAGGDNCRCLLIFIPGTPPDNDDDESGDDE